jgi:hypothetical protein
LVVEKDSLGAEGGTLESLAASLLRHNHRSF